MPAPSTLGPRKVPKGPPAQTRVAVRPLRLARLPALGQPPRLQPRQIRVQVVSRTALTPTATVLTFCYRLLHLFPPAQIREQPTSKLPVCRVSRLARRS